MATAFSCREWILQNKYFQQSGFIFDRVEWVKKRKRKYVLYYLRKNKNFVFDCAFLNITFSFKIKS